MKFNKLMKSTLCLGLAGTMILGSVTTSRASEVVEPTESTVITESTEAAEAVDASEVVESMEAAEEEAKDVIASVPFGDVAVEEVVVIINVNQSQSSVEEAEEIVEDAEAEIDEEGLLNKEETNEEGETVIVEGITESNISDANDEMDVADEALNGTAESESAIDALDDIIKNAEEQYGDASSIEFADSTEASEVINSITEAQEAAQNAYNEAETALGNAQTNLDAAQAAYDAAKAISDEAAAEAEAQLEQAKADLAEAEEAARVANERVIKVQNILDKASEYVEGWKADTDAALEEAQTKLEESKENLDSAIENVETENEEFNDAIADFQEKYDAFVESAKNFYEAVKDAQEKQEALDQLYADYEAAQEAYEAAQEAYADEQAKCEELGYEFGEDYFTNFEAYIAELEAAMESAEATMDAAEAEKDAAEAEKNAYETDEAKAYEDALNGYRDTLKSEEATQEEKDAAAREAAKLVIEKELAAGQTVIWVEAGESEYGKSETGFYVVLDAEGNLVERYGYLVETDEATQTGAVNIYQMTSDEVVNYVEYNGAQYPINVAEDKTLSIVVGEGEEAQTVTVYTEIVNGNVVYYTKDNAMTAEAEDTTKDPVTVKFNISYKDEFEVSLGTLDIQKDDTGYFVKGGLFGTRYDLAQDENGWYYLYTYKDYSVCTKTHRFTGHLGSLTGCEFETKSEKLYLDVTYPTKSQIVYGDAQYDILTDANGALYIDVNGTKVLVYATTDDEGNTTYATRNDVSYITGGTADTTFEIGASTNKNSNTYEAGKNEAANKYNDALDTYNNTVTDYNNAVGAFNTSNEAFEELEAAYNSMNDAKTEAEEKELGSLANLPRSTTDLFEGMEDVQAEDISEILDAIQVLMRDDSSLTGFDKLKATYEKAEAANTLYSMLGLSSYEIKINDITEAAFTDGYKRTYLNAWFAAVEAKANVVVAGMEVVNATSAAIASGLNVINAGAELGDAAIDAALAKIETDLLTGAVGTLAIASDILGVSEQIVDAISAKVDGLQAETQEAYDAVLAAQKALEDLELSNPKAEELDAAKAELDAANERYEDLMAQLEEAEQSLAAATTYRDAAQQEYDKLVDEENKEDETPDDGDDSNNGDDADNNNDSNNDNEDDSKNEENNSGSTDNNEDVNVEDNTNADSNTSTDNNASDQNSTVSSGSIINAANNADEIAEMLAGVSLTRATQNAADDEDIEADVDAVEIEDEETPLADGEEDEAVAIEDEETPLAAGAQEQMNFWWLLLLLVIPVGGAACYYVKKKSAKADKEN